MRIVADVAKAIESSDLKLASELRSCLESGEWEIDSRVAKEPTACDRLFVTYSIRVKNLMNRSSNHARQLKESTNEFVENLSSNKDRSCYLLNVKGNKEHTYMVAYEPVSSMILGLLKTVAQDDVSRERWRELWSAP